MVNSCQWKKHMENDEKWTHTQNKKSHAFSNKPRFSMLTKKYLPVNGINLTALLQLFVLFLRQLLRRCWRCMLTSEDAGRQLSDVFGWRRSLHNHVTPIVWECLGVTMAIYQQKNSPDKFNEKTAPRSSFTCSKHILCCWGSHRASRLNTYRQFPHQLPQWMRVTWSPARVEATNFRCWKPWISTFNKLFDKSQSKGSVQDLYKFQNRLSSVHKDSMPCPFVTRSFFSTYTSYAHA